MKVGLALAADEPNGRQKLVCNLQASHHQWADPIPPIPNGGFDSSGNDTQNSQLHKSVAVTDSSPDTRSLITLAAPRLVEQSNSCKTNEV